MPEPEKHFNILPQEILNLLSRLLHFLIAHFLGSSIVTPLILPARLLGRRKQVFEPLD